MPALAGDLGTELKPGLTVKVVGLKNAPEHNGKRGKLVSFDAERGRWEVRMRSGKAMKIKSENLASDPVTGDTTTSRLERKVNKYAHHLGLVAAIAVSEKNTNEQWRVGTCVGSQGGILAFPGLVNSDTCRTHLVE